MVEGYVKKFIVRYNTAWSIHVQAETEQDALDISASIPFAEWDRADSEYDAEQEG